MRSRGQPCRVLLVDQDRSLQDKVAPLFALGELEPCGYHADYEGALAAAREQRPDVALVELSGPEAFTCIEAVMAEAPTPILCLRRVQESSADDFHALGRGALEIAEWFDDGGPAFWRELSRKLLLISQVRVVRHVRGSKKRRAEGGRRAAEEGEPPFPLVAIAASLGGPKALSTLLRMIPKAFDAPVVICQHISSGFTAGLAQWLSYETALRVAEARDGDWLSPGSVYIAPSGAHLLVTDRAQLKLDPGPPVHGFKPSCDLLLSSSARAFGKRCVGVVLTGMGRDGARGLKEIRSRGGHTLVQDESSCVVYGMPAAAVELGAAEEILPLEELAPALIRLVKAC